MKTHRVLIVAAVILLLLLTGWTHAQGRLPEPDTNAQTAVGTAFTYQGELRDESGPVNDTCNLTFALYDAPGSGTPPTGGTLLGTVAKPGQEIVEGRFTVALDFGSGVFEGSARWLQITVDCGDGAVTLSPRQRLTPAPYAVNADLLDGQHASGFASAVHDHLGETWTGSQNPLTIEGAYGSISDLYLAPLTLRNTAPYGNGLNVESVAANGIDVKTAGYDGVFVYEATQSGLAVREAGWHGVRVGDAAGNGVLVESSVDDGLQVDYTDSYGVYVDQAGAGGFRVDDAPIGLSVVAAESIGVGIGSASDHGVVVAYAGSDAMKVERADGDGLQVDLTYAHGVHVIDAHGDGLQVDDADGDGVFVDNAGGDGVHVDNPGGYGMYVHWAGSDGMLVHAAFGHGYHAGGVGGDGLQVDAAAGNGVQIHHADGNGLRVNSAGLNGVEIWGATYDGVQVNSAGRYGVQANTDGTYGFYTPDKIYAGDGYSDIAEHVDAVGAVEPGDVVVIDPERDERVVRSTTPYDTAVAGIISTDPAMVIGESETETPLALAGRVPCKVSAENGSIRRGDLLTTSSTPGHAMKATEPRLGTVLGKAMGELESGTGVITVLVTLQ